MLFRSIIDLSWRAAKELGMLQQGVAMVKVEKYVENKGIPFKQETELPELDYEVTNRGDGITPAWQEKDGSAKEDGKHTGKEK